MLIGIAFAVVVVGFIGVVAKAVRENDRFRHQDEKRNAALDDLQRALAATAPIIDQLREELMIERRRSSEYFKLIESIEIQRNEWKELFFLQSGQHLEAQAYLENTLVYARQVLLNAVEIINKGRETNKLEPPFKELLDPPVGLSLDYKESMRRLVEAREKGLPKKALEKREGEAWSGPEIDGKSVREKISLT